MVSLVLVPVRRPSIEERYSWAPFEPNDEFNDDWWCQPPYLRNDPWYVKVLQDEVEVARVELDESFRGSAYEGAPDLGDEALEIQFIEVARSQRRRRLATRVVQAIAEENSGRRLLAFSVDADAFWESLGWDRFDDLSRGPHLPGSPLFIEPERIESPQSTDRSARPLVDEGKVAET